MKSRDLLREKNVEAKLLDILLDYQAVDNNQVRIHQNADEQEAMNQVQ